MAIAEQGTKIEVVVTPTDSGVEVVTLQELGRKNFPTIEEARDDAQARLDRFTKFQQPAVRAVYGTPTVIGAATGILGIAIDEPVVSGLGFGVMAACGAVGYVIENENQQRQKQLREELLQLSRGGMFFGPHSK